MRYLIECFKLYICLYSAYAHNPIGIGAADEPFLGKGALCCKIVIHCEYGGYLLQGMYGRKNTTVYSMERIGYGKVSDIDKAELP